MASPLLLGIDTGGTYTDAVLFREDLGVIAKAKSLTTRRDLSQGVAGAVSAALEKGAVSAADIAMVSLSTTLATNALVEGQGGRAALIMIGFGPDDLVRAGLSDALGTDPVIFLPGGHDVHGNETPLDMATLEADLPALGSTVSSFAVAGYFAVRNPAHEIRVRDRIRALSHKPVTCSHELSSRLGGPRRALTTLLNARLVSIIDRLIGSTEDFLKRSGIDAPLMVVRGDGALMSASEARLRPIETILSGPAASLVGARYLTGLDNAVVSDIGGTTTDVAILQDGRPKLAPDGANVGGHDTMVEAVAMRTYGLGGDSEVHVDERGLEARITLGPRRLLPLSLLAASHEAFVMEVLEQQFRAPHPGRHDGRFVIRIAAPGADHGLQPQEHALLVRIGTEPVALTALLTMNSQKAVLDRLVGRGTVQLSGITPSDALHVLGRQGQWNGKAARLGLQIAARRKNGAGREIAGSADELAKIIVDRLTRQSAEAILSACLAEDGAGAIDPAVSLAVDRALKRSPGIARFSLALDRPLVGLGASAPVYYPAIADMLGAGSIIPADADVANAIGAVVGQIRVTCTVTVTSPEQGLYVIAGSGETIMVAGESHALDMARQRAHAAAREKAGLEGAGDVLVTLEEEIAAPEIEGERRLVEARITAFATGRPRMTHS
ncbi:hydantoinase/oxoprolinase family protein [Neorhizobium sp. NCHU2750]|uniref:hydantoinase/oxoprolinase N-terminal domain-containing protein n=1 Tax=Neorhizobium sp. NCHU2750 TaxID=1825976 RepID=UPI000E72C4A5|nr:hydantoinase [Neorhizobium sp. NCHU2750]